MNGINLQATKKKEKVLEQKLKTTKKNTLIEDNKSKLLARSAEFIDIGEISALNIFRSSLGAI
jgi:hypothetical protein